MSEDQEEKIWREKSETGKQETKKKGISSLYKIQNDDIVRLRPTCERCGPGYFMADHGDRYTCGRCGFTRYKLAEEQE